MTETERAIAIIEARLPLYTDIGQINALRECISSIRSAALSAGQAQPVVKALEWEYVERGTMTYTAYWADGDVSYYIDQSFGTDSYYFRTIRWPDETIYDGDDLPSAQAAAQSDYEARIRAALVGVGE